LEVFFEAKNLTNKIYAATVEPIADARSGDDVDSFNPGNGRSFYGGMTWRW
jgi:outer membrane receptor protein involved in Fe transport